MTEVRFSFDTVLVDDEIQQVRELTISRLERDVPGEYAALPAGFETNLNELKRLRDRLQRAYQGVDVLCQLAPPEEPAA